MPFLFQKSYGRTSGLMKPYYNEDYDFIPCAVSGQQSSDPNGYAILLTDDVAGQASNILATLLEAHC